MILNGGSGVLFFHVADQELKVHLNGVLQEWAEFDMDSGLITFSVEKSGLF
jgi:hypothetical protein